jgi:phosphoserine phosphatase RsbU/P
MKKNPPILQYVMLSILFVGVCAYQVRAAIYSFPGFLNPHAAAWPFLVDYSGGQPKIEFAKPEAIAAGIHDHDVITAINGRPFKGLAVYGEEISKSKPGDTLVATAHPANSTAERTFKVLLTAPPRTVNWALAFVVLIQWLKGRELEQIFPEWLVLGGFTLMLLFPVTLAYTIVVQRALDVRVVIRQGLQYALATRGIIVLRILLIATLVSTAISFVLNAHLSLARATIVISLMIVAVLWISRGAQKLRAWTDRRFFRDAYDAEQVLAGLSDEVRTIVETRPLLERVASTIADSLHVPQIAILLEENGAYRPAYALGYGGAPSAVLPSNSVTIDHLRKLPEPARIYFDDENSWVNSLVPEDERRTIAALDPQLFLPLCVKDKLLGIISLGEKKSEAPYSGADLRLLKSVATQTGLALANAQLTSEIAEEVSRREKMSRELEIAREVQERLFPQKLPEIGGLDYLGRCRTALGVGGDYYDFLALPGGKLGVALGDVSGKGIAAALMMASLEASLRAEAMRAGNDLGTIIESVNNMVYDASAEDRYATLFYAQYEPASRRLAYVNAGHCAPMVFRNSSPDDLERLDQAGGPGVGLMPDCKYEQAEIALLTGDVIVIYTDGISEAMNPSLEEWGEERVAKVARDATSLCAEKIIAKIVEAADAFAAGAPQHDDMTLVVLRVP